MSSIRSASSMTRMSTALSKSLPRSKWSSRRPGVAISTSAPRSSLRNWSSKETPPISSATFNRWFLPYLTKFSSTCAASSRVGSRMRVRGMRARARPCSSSVSIGRTKDAVLPVPVWAMPRTSLRCSACGMAPAWIGVGIVYPAASTALSTFVERPRSAKVVKGDLTFYLHSVLRMSVGGPSTGTRIAQRFCCKCVTARGSKSQLSREVTFKSLLHLCVILF